MSKRAVGLVAIVTAALAFSSLASARHVGSIGVVIRPVVENPEGDETPSDEAPGDVCTTESGFCWEF